MSSSTQVLSEDQTTTGASDDDIRLNARFSNTVMIEVKVSSGSPTFAVAPQVQVTDTGTWYSTYAEDMSDGSVVTSITAAGLYRLFSSGLHSARANVTSISGGGVEIHARGAIG